MQIQTYEKIHVPKCIFVRNILKPRKCKYIKICKIFRVHSVFGRKFAENPKKIVKFIQKVHKFRIIFLQNDKIPIL